MAALAAFSPSGPAAAGRYSIQDEGAFAPTGRRVEFADRYGWRSYKLEFQFGLDEGTRRLSGDSILSLSISKVDGKEWKYRCKNSSRDSMRANINLLYGKGTSVLVECRIRPDKFASAVDLDEELVGEPTLVFHALVKDGQAQPGAQKGLYILTGGQIEAGEMNQYAIRSPDPSELAVIFASGTLYPHHPYFQPLPRFIP